MGGDVVAGNFIGTDPTGGASAPNNGGILVATDSNMIGGASGAARNVISANIGRGVLIRQATTRGTAVAGNFIGTDKTGTLAQDANGNALGNGMDGVALTSGANNNTIGGATAGALGVVA